MLRVAVYYPTDIFILYDIDCFAAVGVLYFLYDSFADTCPFAMDEACVAGFSVCSKVFVRKHIQGSPLFLFCRRLSRW